ncbi:MAG: hypothetical protein KatS3mg131_1474 [Candidatus Tectimicrobiota bacterium]|nr:MAG: hypothetical protein KatS3mg131_1474 [Candidatus Tectomicrobia bacterium]
MRFRQGLWESAARLRAWVWRELLDATPAPALRRLRRRLLQGGLVVWRGFFYDHQCLLRASALTYTTLLALVPMLAFAFAFLKGLGVPDLLERLLRERLAPASEEAVRLILAYVSNVKAGTLGVMGLGALFFSTLLQFGTVEQAFNTIWGVPRGRPLLRKLTDYLSLMVVGPVVLLLATALTAALRSNTLVALLLERRLIGDAMLAFFTLLPYVAVWLAFTFFYLVIPNTRVRLGPALLGGLVGGTLWQLAQWAYLVFQIGLTRYHAIYGAFAQLPLLMIWIYLSWVVTLLGAEIAFACQHAPRAALERLAPSIYAREWLASSLYFSLVRAFRAGEAPWSAAAFAHQLSLPLHLVHEVVATLVQAGLLVEVAAPPEHYVPARDPATLTPWQVLQALRHHGDPRLEALLAGRDALASSLMQRAEEAMAHAAGTCSVTQWLAAAPPLPRPD